MDKVNKAQCIPVEGLLHPCFVSVILERGSSGLLVMDWACCKINPLTIALETKMTITNNMLFWGVTIVAVANHGVVTMKIRRVVLEITTRMTIA